MTRAPARRRLTILGTTGLALGVLAASLPYALGSPHRDPFAMALPTRDTKPPDGLRSSGGGRVAEQQGSATYAVAIEVPDGRNGMAPRLALTYSSDGPLRGGIAVGWSLDVPTIERDPGFPTEKRYRTSLGGGWQRLLGNTTDPGTRPRYRAEVDDTFTRYTYDSGTNHWHSRSIDGVVRSYRPGAAWRWHLATETDPYGNQVDYEYERVTNNDFEEYQLRSIHYTSNANAGLEAHARIDFVYGVMISCGGQPVGASTDHHFGAKRWTGSRPVQAIEISVKDGVGGGWRLARRYALHYDKTETECGASALRYLTQIDETAYTQAGVATSAPAIRFDYGPTQPEFGRTIQVTNAEGGDAGIALGPTTMLVDMDGDGLVDRVEMETGVRCQLAWRKGVGIGQFADEATRVELPTAAWRQGESPEPDEVCTLSGQRVVRSWAYSPNQCSFETIEVGYHLMDFDADGLLDVVTTLHAQYPEHAGGDFYEGDVFSKKKVVYQTRPKCRIDEYVDAAGVCHSLYGCYEQGGYFNPFTGGCESAPGVPTGGDPLAPVCTVATPAPEQTPSLDAYVWRVQRNQGGGQLAPIGSAWRVHAPRPLTPNGGAVTLDGVPRPTLPRLADMNGDGYLDLVALMRKSVPGPNNTVHYSETMPGECLFVDNQQICQLFVWPGGDFSAQGAVKTFGAQQTWTTQPFGVMLQGTTNVTSSGTDVVTTTTTVSLRDVNADGLPDMLVRDGQGYLAVAYNQSGAMTAPGQYTGAFSAPVRQWVHGWIEEARAEIPTMYSWIRYLHAGHRAELRQLVDLDGDGYLDQVTVTPGASVAGLSTAREARRLTGSGTVSETPRALASHWEAVENLVTATHGRWRRVSEYTDVTGDGVPDLVYWQADGSWLVYTNDGEGPPMRLLQTVDNGRGAVTRFEYASSSDPSVVDRDGRPLSPRHVVTRMMVTPGFEQPAMTTTYRYARPAHGRTSPIDPNAPGFLGFEEVTVEQSGQQGEASLRTVRSYAYWKLWSDWRGGLDEELTEILVDGAYVPVKHVDHAYTAELVAGTWATFTYRTHQIERTCEPGATAISCAGQVTGVRTVTDTWVPWNGPSGAPALYLHHRTEETDGASTRYTQYGYDVRFGTGAHRVLQSSEIRGAVAKGVDHPWSRFDTIHDAAGLPVETREYRDAVTWSSTRRSFDPQTGNVVSVVQPNQVASGTNLGEQYAYDPFRLRIASRTNELYQSEWATYDLATGAMLSRTGPSYRAIDVPGCSWWCFLRAYDEERWVIDGFGRVVEHLDSLDPTVPGGTEPYELRTVEVITYDDQALPNRRVVARLRDAATGETVDDEEAFDGLGRVIETTARRHLEGQCDPQTRYEYDAAGALAAVHAPDPSADTCATVVTRYARDGLGRVTAMTRPDGSSELVAYRGLATSVEERSPIDGIGTRTTLVHGPFGELVEVHEHDNPAPGATAVTRYHHDPLGRVTAVIDADGQVTSLRHDWRGLRTSVSRAGRTWTYEYDASGNLVAETEPVPPGHAAADYRSTTEYDVLDRPYRYTPATRGLSETERAELGIGPIATWYDGEGAVGLPSRIGLPFGTIYLSYDALGRVSREQRTLSLSPTLDSLWTTQWVERRFDVLGNPVEVAWDDGTRWQYGYDRRGAVTDVRWLDPATGELVTLAAYERSPAGQPRVRTSDYSSQRRDWRYDVLGRVVYDRIWRPASNHTYHERVYGYDGFGELRLTQGSTYTMSADAVYEYDARHRVTRAEGPGAYDAAFTYGPTGNVLTARVSGALDVPDRDVEYLYGDVDPQAVDALIDRQTGTWVGGAAYDHAGNMVERSTVAASHTFLHDADGMLRRAQGPGGDERYLFGPDAERIAAVGPDGIRLWFDESETQLTGAGVPLARYHHVAAGEPVARVASGGAAELQYADVLQNLILSVHQNGAVMAAFVYGAFGEVVGDHDVGEHRRRFNGKEHDELTGLRHYGYRSYDPMLLRWASADPLYRFEPDAAWTEPQRANLYAFTLNNALRYVDPDGRDAERDFEGALALVELIAPENDDSTGEVVAKAGGAIVLAVPIAVTAIWEWGIQEFKGPFGLSDNYLLPEIRAPKAMPPPGVVPPPVSEDVQARASVAGSSNPPNPPPVVKRPVKKRCAAKRPGVKRPGGKKKVKAKPKRAGSRKPRPKPAVRAPRPPVPRDTLCGGPGGRGSRHGCGIVSPRPPVRK